MSVILEAGNARSTKLFGVQTLQSWPDLGLWEWFLNDHPELRTIIELGTFKGGLTAYLIFQCQVRDIVFRTIDVITWFEGERVKNVVRPYFTQGDILTGDIVEGWLRTVEHPLLLVCDGGNKPAEFQKYTPQLQAGDFISVHDFGSEFFERDAAPVIAMLEMEHELRHRDIGSMTRFYRRVSGGT